MFLKSQKRISVMVILLFSAVCVSEAKIVRYTFNIYYVSGSPDGVLNTKILAINGRFPGPTIEAVIGDTLKITVVNRIQDKQNTSLHWHGIHQRGTPFEDGPSLITQCPLKAGQTQVYEFELKQAGTYWYHGHVQSQYSEGLWGALIIKNKPEVYQYDDEIVLSLSDWYHRSAKENEAWYLSPRSAGVPPYPDSVMMNGMGRYPCDMARLQNRTCRTNLQRRQVFQLSPGKPYRIRVINTSSRTSFHFSIDDHQLQTIEVDGVDVARPIPAQVVPLAPGQRYSFLVSGNGIAKRYLIRAAVNLDELFINRTAGNINTFPDALVTEVTAVLTYKKSGNNVNIKTRVVSTTERFDYTKNVPEKIISGLEFLDETKLSPYDQINAPAVVTQEFVLTTGWDFVVNDTMRFSFNQTRFQLPETRPLLHTILDNEPIPEGVFALTIDYLSVVQIVVNNRIAGHPFHLHGHSFWVLRTGAKDEGDFDPKIHNLSLTGPRRDTVFVPTGSSTVIRFKADNPGAWAFHCHIDWHNLGGMALVFVEAAEEARRTLTIPAKSNNLCRM